MRIQAMGGGYRFRAFNAFCVDACKLISLARRAFDLHIVRDASQTRPSFKYRRRAVTT